MVNHLPPPDAHGGERRTNLKKLLACVALSGLVGCGESQSLSPQDQAEVIGSWSGGEVLEQARPDSQVVYFSPRPDGSVALSLIYELGPRSRVNTYDMDVEYHAGVISWPYHRGRLNSARDTMWVSKNYRGDRSEWMWVRNRGADPLMERFHAMEMAPVGLTLPLVAADGWECADPESAGLNEELLTRFLFRVSEGDFGDIHSFLVARHGALAVEEYFAEGGRRHGPLIDSVYRDRTHHLASTTKAVTSTLMGIALDRGLIAHVQDSIIHYLPGYAHLLLGAKEGITIDHLLTMSPGLEWSQSGPWNLRNDARAILDQDDVVGYVLGKDLEHEPGRRFEYSNGATVVAGAVLESATSGPVGEFAEEVLFRPLGITDYLWTTYSDGSVETDGGLALRPRDLAKIGQLFLDRGWWHGAPIVSEDWVAHSTRPRFTFGSIGGAPVSYGSCWMTWTLPTPDGPVGSFFHPGDGGQLLLVIPELEMVVVFTAGAFGEDWKRTYHAIISEYLLAVTQRRIQ
jgi:CubicO group peptidase (beta-lactamase class C family)